LMRIASPDPLTFSGLSFRTFSARLGAIVSSLGLHGGFAILMIWAFCGFRYSAFNPSLPPGEFNASWDYVLSIGGWKAEVINFCRNWHLLPEGYLYGFTFVLRFAEARG